MLNSGDVFAGFTVERLLGQGGMGSVYLARHPRLGKLTALKLLNRELYADREIRARFEREADLVARLDHPNIVEVYDRGTENDMLWISMQYVDGIDAASVNVGTLPPERAVQIIEGVADALDYAHGMGVLHRDVKPANIILARAVGGHGERVFLTDFGIARLREDSTHLTQAGMFTATLAYASPEQMTGAPIDPTTDQYSLACALYWLLIGAGPYDSPHPAELIRGHLQLLPPPVSLRRPGLSPAMDAVLTKAMAKRPTDRFPTCTAFAKAARQALSGPPAQHPALQQQLRPTYPNPHAPQPNYPAAQPYPSPGYPSPPQGYPAPAPQQPSNYPAPPQPSAQPPQQPIPAPAPNYPAPQPQPIAPAPSGYPAPPQQPAAPQPPAQDPDRAGSGPTARPYPQGTEGVPPIYPTPPQPPSAGTPLYPVPPQPTWLPQRPSGDTERINSGPTARPYPSTQEPAANYPAPQPQSPPHPRAGGTVGPQSATPAQQQPNPEAGHVGSAPTYRPPASEMEQAGSGPTYRPQPAGVPDDPSRRPTDIVPQPVVSAGQQEDSAEGRAQVLPQPGGAAIGRGAAEDAAPGGAARSGSGHTGAVTPASAGTEATMEDSSGTSDGTSSVRSDIGETDEADSAVERGQGGMVGSPGFEEMISEPMTVLAQPIAQHGAASDVRPQAAEARSGDAGAGGESAGAAQDELSGEAADTGGGADAHAAMAKPGAVVRGGESAEDAPGVAAVGGAGADVVGNGPGTAGGAGGDGESGGASRHPDSGAFVPAGAVEVGDGATSAEGVAESGESESVSGDASDWAAPGESGVAPGSGQPAGMGIPGAGGEPGYGGYGGMPGGPGYGGPGQFGPNPVGPGLIPTSQRAEASQVTALVVLGLAVAVLVLMVVVAVVVVSG
ncbi:serine/threonine-protein kinase [Nocardia terrae]|uniref:serine/threonine-protein kinase n=1 Tax=Nocardia terrae TaxID=2675851 RepID=UPI002E272796